LHTDLPAQPSTQPVKPDHGSRDHYRQRSNRAVLRFLIARDVRNDSIAASAWIRAAQRNCDRALAAGR